MHGILQRYSKLSSASSFSIWIPLVNDVASRQIAASQHSQNSRCSQRLRPRRSLSISVFASWFFLQEEFLHQLEYRGASSDRVVSRCAISRTRILIVVKALVTSTSQSLGTNVLLIVITGGVARLSYVRHIPNPAAPAASNMIEFGSGTAAEATMAANVPVPFSNS